MGTMTIGEFARASRLSPKALRLYDELGLLRPVRVDPTTGYRYYDPAQLERARLVAWLRRIGMPLAHIRDVCELDGPAAAQKVRTFWARLEADTATRRDLAAFLVDHLCRKDTTMTDTGTPLAIRYAALSDTGLVQESNQDAVYAGSHLLAVADGFGTAGASAGAAAIDTLKRLDTDGIPAGNLLNILEDTIRQADRAVRDIAGAEPSPHEVGTTLTAMVWTGSRLALVHIGDSRAYLLRDGELFRITHDHTFVQSMLDEGRITPEEATTHPQRSLLLRALVGGAGADVAPDIRLHDVRSGDRYLLCSDGLSTVVPTDTMCQAMSSTPDPEYAVRRLVTLANRAGGPDNITCVVADVTEQRQ
ncbi:MerR family transcriptional regulator [Embleya sp. AB8]|uniref:MerR family transcriptional regulator n=1 Tax=Embleya sp. AB8 TaxID=3156304 RepID=UPI003C70C0F6